MKHGHYATIVPQLLEVYLIFAGKGYYNQVENVRAAMVEVKNHTTESDLSCTRFMFQKIDEDQFKEDLQPKITAYSNSYSLISCTILLFSLHLSYLRDQLQLSS